MKRSSGRTGRLLPGVIAAMLAASFATCAAAQAPTPFRRITSSPLAQVTFPYASFAWTGDPREKENSMAQAADVVKRTCGTSEFYVWQTPDDNIAQSTLTKTDAAFTAAGWSLKPMQTIGAGETISIATKAGTDLVMAWVPADTYLALLLCKADPVD